MAKTPLMTEIKEIKLTKFPAYEHSKQVEDDLLAKYTTTSKAWFDCLLKIVLCVFIIFINILSTSLQSFIIQ